MRTQTHPGSVILSPCCHLTLPGSCCVPGAAMGHIVSLCPQLAEAEPPPLGGSTLHPTPGPTRADSGAAHEASGADVGASLQVPALNWLLGGKPRKGRPWLHGRPCRSLSAPHRSSLPPNSEAVHSPSRGACCGVVLPFLYVCFHPI